MDAPSLIEELRFGFGPRLGRSLAPGGVEPDRVLAQLASIDLAAAVWNRPGLAERQALIDAARQIKKSGQVLTTEAAKAGPAMALKRMEQADVSAFVARPAVAEAGFAERLVAMWANRVTVSVTSPAVGHYVQSFRDEAIRPHIAGRYADMVKAALWHPAMQVYLSQVGSIGPNSKIGRKKGKGLNENLAREFLELHTMGRGYAQADVTELARLLAGMEAGGRVDDKRAEPGEKVILGKAFGEGAGQIDALVEDIAHRPETAAAVSLFLTRHFITDTPEFELTAALAKAYMDHDTALLPMYRVLLQHPLASAPARQKVRSPQEYLVASLRLLGMDGQEKNLPGFPKAIPLADYLGRMGQPPFRPLRPDGWPEVAAGWMTPPMMAARVDWAVDLARAVGDRVEPSDVVDLALGDFASPLLRRAVAGAEQRWEGLAVLIASPEFGRR